VVSVLVVNSVGFDYLWEEGRLVDLCPTTSEKKSSSILALHAKYMLLGAWKFVGVSLDGCVPGVWEAACIFNIKY
jgi:hypothetical protein